MRRAIATLCIAVAFALCVELYLRSQCWGGGGVVWPSSRGGHVCVDKKSIIVVTPEGVLPPISQEEAE